MAANGPYKSVLGAVLKQMCDKQLTFIVRVR